MDVIELILSEHDRIRRLLAALDDAARYAAPGARGCPDRMLATIWARIVTLLTLHVDAEQEICFLPVYRGRRGWLTELEDAAAVLNDARDAIAEARLQQAGSPAWWRAVEAARRSVCAHIFATEHGLLADFRARSDDRFRQQLGHQWAAFVTARRRDGVSEEQEFRAARTARGPAAAITHPPRPAS